VEFVVTSVTSPTLPINISEGFIQVLNPHVQYVDLLEHGFVLIDFDADRVQGDWVYVNNLEVADPGYQIGASYRCGEGQSWLQAAPVALAAEDNGVLTAPDCPFEGISAVEENFPVMLSAYPNPFFDRIVMQFALFQQDRVSVKLYDLGGRMLLQEYIGELATGVHYLELKGLDVPSGVYLLELLGNEGKSAVWKMQRY
jgi:hypothetical protein